MQAGRCRVPGLRPALSAAVLGIAYFLLATASLTLTRFDGHVASLWLATGLLMPALAAMPQRQWGLPMLACGTASAAASSLFGAGVEAAIPVTVLLIGEAALGAWLLKCTFAVKDHFTTLARVGRFVLITGGIAPATSALGGAFVGVIFFDLPFATGAAAWFIVHSLGTLIIAPLVVQLLPLFAAPGQMALKWRAHRIETALLAVALLVDVLVFAQSSYPLLYLPALPLLFLAFRGGPLAAGAGVAGLAFIGGALSAAGLGPLSLMPGGNGEKTLFFQFYLMVSFVMTLPIAAEIARRQAESHRVAESEAMFRLMADRSGDVLMIVAAGGTIHYISPAILGSSGYETQELIGRHALQLIDPVDHALVRAEYAALIARPDTTSRFEYRAITRSGTRVWFETHARAIVGADGQVTSVVSAARDISLHKAVEIQLTDAANRDTLTGLVNRRYFDSQLAHGVATAQGGPNSLWLAIVDVDFFKRINDSHGHGAGDQVLKSVAALLLAALRSEDVVARIGGEEFGLLLPNLRDDAATNLCERLRQAVTARPVMVGAIAIPVTVSIGLARADGYNGPTDALAAADAALYRAKGDGRNRLRLAA